MQCKLTVTLVYIQVISTDDKNNDQQQIKKKEIHEQIFIQIDNFSYR